MISNFKSWVQNPRRRNAMKVRSEVEHEIRQFFYQRQFQEVRTPLLVPSPGMEPHIHPLELKAPPLSTGRRFLPTSPEFAMKKLLVGGLERIFQIAPAFRAEPPSSTHSPEFTLLEWYRSHASLEDIFNDTENLIVHLATQLKGSTQFHFQGTPLDVTPPWPRWTTQELFTRYCGIDLATTRSLTAFQNECKRLHVDFNPTDTWDDLYFRVWLNVIEPKLPTNRAFFVTAYPGSQAALAVKDRDSTGWETARRFECYLGGIELANAFEELTDPVEQRKRFEEDMELRQRVYGSSFPKSPIDEEFLLALKEGLPPSGGIALGVDRLVMIFADEPEIQFTFWIPPTL